MGAAGRAYVGRPIHGQQGWPHGLPSWRERREKTVRRGPGSSPLLHSDDSGAGGPAPGEHRGSWAPCLTPGKSLSSAWEGAVRAMRTHGGKGFVGLMCWTNGVRSFPSTPLLPIDPDRPLPLRLLVALECSWQANCPVPQPFLCTSLPLATSPGTWLSPRGVSSSRPYWLQRWGSQSQSPKS